MKDATNPYNDSDQCTWYAWQTMYDMTGKAIPFSDAPDARKWYTSVHRDYRSKMPASPSVACWSGGTYGHVGVVESWNGSTMDFTDRNFDEHGGTRNLTGITIEEMKADFGSSYTFQGFIVLD